MHVGRMTSELQTYRGQGIVGICPHAGCEKKAQQIPITLPLVLAPDGYTRVFKDLSATLCARCRKTSYWKDEKLLYPYRKDPAPAHNRDMPASIQKLFEEAADICLQSPRSAAALLRVAVSNLCVELGANGENTADRIGDLVLKGLPVQTLVSLENAGMIGEIANEPGKIEFEDDLETAQSLFFTLNMIVETMISKKRKLADKRDYNAVGKIVSNIRSITKAKPSGS